MTDTPETSALALGKLIGTVEGLVRAIDEQNKNSATRKKEQDETAAKSRDEFMGIFKEIRDEMKSGNEVVQMHIKEDQPYHQLILEVESWRNAAAPKIDTMWDNTNKGKGAVWASGIFGTFIGGCIVTAVEYLKK